MPLLTAYLNPREYGAIAVLNLVSLFLIALCSLGFGTSISLFYFDSDSKSERDQLIWSAACGLAITALLVVVLGVLTLPLWSGWLISGDEFRGAAMYMLLSIAATVLTVPFDLRLRLDERQTTFIIASVFSTFTVGVLLTLFVVGLRRGVGGYFEALFIGRLLSLVCFVHLAAKGSAFSCSLAKIKRLIRLGLPTAPQFVFIYALHYGNVEELKRFIGLDAAGIYSVGLTLGVAINVIVSSIANAWAPFFMSYVNRRDEASRLFGRITTYYVYGVGCLTLLFYYLAKPLVILLSSPSFYEAHQVVGLTATAFFIFGFYNLLLPPVYYAKEVRVLTYLLGCAAVFFLLVGAILIPSFRLLGAGWALVFAYTVLNFLLLGWNRAQGERYFKIAFEKKRLFSFLAVYLCSIILLCSLTNLAPFQTALIYCVHFLGVVTLVMVSLERDELRALGYYSRSVLAVCVRRKSLV